jgi:hypothetical protein
VIRADKSLRPSGFFFTSHQFSAIIRPRNLCTNRGTGRMTKLSQTRAAKLPNGKHHDGLGLYVLVRDENRSWLFRYERGGRERWMGLGRFADLSLEDARNAARAARNHLREGKDPLAERRSAPKILDPRPARGRSAEPLFPIVRPTRRNGARTTRPIRFGAWRRTRIRRSARCRCGRSISRSSSTR